MSISDTLRAAMARGQARDAAEEQARQQAALAALDATAAARDAERRRVAEIAQRAQTDWAIRRNELSAALERAEAALANARLRVIDRHAEGDLDGARAAAIEVVIGEVLVPAARAQLEGHLATQPRTYR